MIRPVDQWGRLQDFEPRFGDPPPPTGRRRRWAGAVLLTANQALIANARGRAHATVIATDDLGEPQSLLVEAFFAANSASNEPVLPWSRVMPAFSPQISLAIRRYSDPLALPIVDTHTVLSTERLGVDVVSGCTRLSVDADLVDESGSVWVNVLCTPVYYASPHALVTGWSRLGSQLFVPAIASPAAIQLAPFRNSRAQVWIVNTSTNADLIVAFGGPAEDASWVGPNGAIVLPQASFATWESPAGNCPYERISGSWNNAAPNGGALVTEGLIE